MKRFSRKIAGEWLARLTLLKDGATKSEVALRDDLQTSIDNVCQSLIDQLLGVDTKSNEKVLQKRLAQEAKATALLVLSKVQGALSSSSAGSELEFAHGLYHVDKIKTKSRTLVLALLHHAESMTATQTETAYQLPADTLQEVQAAAATLQGHLNAIVALEADLVALRSAVCATVNTTRDLKHQTHGYLVSVLPLGKHDPKLIDFGLRIGGRRRSSPVVTVVVEEESVPA